MVKTKSLYDPVEAGDGDRILITRYWPRGMSRDRMSAEWVQALAPSRALLNDWKRSRIDWKEYTHRYHAEMQEQEDSIGELARKSQAGTITLLCFEREGDPHCHRHLLAKLVEERARGL